MYGPQEAYIPAMQNGDRTGIGVLGLLGRELRIGMYGVAQTRTRLLGRQCSDPSLQVNTTSRFPAKT